MHAHSSEAALPGPALLCDVVHTTDELFMRRLVNALVERHAERDILLLEQERQGRVAHVGCELSQHAGKKAVSGDRHAAVRPTRRLVSAAEGSRRRRTWAWWERATPAPPPNEAGSTKYPPVIRRFHSGYAPVYLAEFSPVFP